MKYSEEKKKILDPSAVNIIDILTRLILSGGDMIRDVCHERSIHFFDIYSCNPWELPMVYKRPEWRSGQMLTRTYYFTPRHRANASGRKTRRTAGGGHWNAPGFVGDIITTMGSDSHVSMEVVIGQRQQFTFKIGKGKKDNSTDWVMHEYTLSSSDPNQFQDMAICSLYKKEKKRGNMKRGEHCDHFYSADYYGSSMIASSIHQEKEKEEEEERSTNLDQDSVDWLLPMMMTISDDDHEIQEKEEEKKMSLRKRRRVEELPTLLIPSPSPPPLPLPLPLPLLEKISSSPKLGAVVRPTEEEVEKGTTVTSLEEVKRMLLIEEEPRNTICTSEQQQQQQPEEKEKEKEKEKELLDPTLIEFTVEELLSESSLAEEEEDSSTSMLPELENTIRDEILMQLDSLSIEDYLRNSPLLEEGEDLCVLSPAEENRHLLSIFGSNLS